MKYSTLTSAVALAIDSGNKDLIDVYLSSPKMAFQRPVGTVQYTSARYKLENFGINYYAGSNANVVAYALY